MLGGSSLAKIHFVLYYQITGARNITRDVFAQLCQYRLNVSPVLQVRLDPRYLNQGSGKLMSGERESLKSLGNRRW